ncbi:E3 ubiquitin-protein ligase BRE1-like [Miscanthus floridulus]|uniref:E3 ubiquitin-protein ligase BRE1-like n=1 Tax=Miscanthus floridulus TaxID=154761 RepID=UPI00345972F8
MAKGDRKVQSEDEGSDSYSDSDDEFEAPTYDELAKLLGKYTKIIMKTRAKNGQLEQHNDSLIDQLDIATRASNELKSENKSISSLAKELKLSLKELKEKHDKLERTSQELRTRYNLLQDEYTNVKINYDTLLIANEYLVDEPHVAINPIAKIDVATSCDDLMVEFIEQESSCKGKQVVVANHYDDYVKIKNENEKLKLDLAKLTTTKAIVIEAHDEDYDMSLEVDKLREENKKLKIEKNHLAIGFEKFTKGHNL